MKIFKECLLSFLFSGNRQELVISQNVGGQLQVSRYFRFLDGCFSFKYPIIKLNDIRYSYFNLTQHCYFRYTQNGQVNLRARVFILSKRN